MNDRAPAIVVDGVSKRFRRPEEQMHTLKERALHPFRRSQFNEFTAVSDVSFAVEQGEFFGIVGRNGSGKSTLLKLIAGIYQTSAGSIWVNGRMSTFIELGVGFNPDLAARDNVVLNAVMLGLSQNEARERYERVLEFSELHEYENVKLKNYSSGMHVRLAFAVMIQVNADVLLIDEVLAVGDAAFQQKCFDQFNRLRDEGRTIVLVTHDMGSVRRFCHRAMVLERGHLVETGDPVRVGERYLELNFHHEQPEDVSDERDRFGDGTARFVGLWIETADHQPLEVAPRGQELVIGAHVQFNADVDDPVVSLVLEDDQHRPVFATSSVWTNELTGSFRAGDFARLEVRFENVLAPGHYFVTPTVARRGSGQDVLDRYPGMMSFIVTGTRDSEGVVDLDHDLSFRRADYPVEV